jgi:hypothetical protein
MSAHCPSCNRILYNRRLTKCGFCGALLPEHLRFTPEEIAKLEKIEKELEKSAEERRKQADEQYQQDAASQGSFDISVDIGPFL